MQREKLFLIIRPQQTIPRIESADLIANLIVVISEPFASMLGLLDFSILSFRLLERLLGRGGEHGA
jgi:hypothetical protein